MYRETIALLVAQKPLVYNNPAEFPMRGFCVLPQLTEQILIRR